MPPEPPITVIRDKGRAAYWLSLSDLLEQARVARQVMRAALSGDAQAITRVEEVRRLASDELSSARYHATISMYLLADAQKEVEAERAAWSAYQAQAQQAAPPPPPPPAPAPTPTQPGDARVGAQPGAPPPVRPAAPATPLEGSCPHGVDRELPCPECVRSTTSAAQAAYQRAV